MRLEERLIQALAERKMTIAVAESCTGGLLGARITSIPGSSVVFLASVVPYSNELKRTMLGVSAQTLEKHGAVSEEAAAEMLKGVLKVTGANIGVSTTGIAGPAGATEAKPIGTVIMCVGSADKPVIHRMLFKGDRAGIRAQTVDAAMTLVLEHIGAGAPAAEP